MPAVKQPESTDHLPDQIKEMPCILERLYHWEYESGWLLPVVRVTLWFPWGDSRHEPSAPGYFQAAFADFLDAWRWAEQNWELTAVPEFSTSGRTGIQPGTGEQTYSQLAAMATLSLGSARKSAPASTTSSES